MAIVGSPRQASPWSQSLLCPPLVLISLNVQTPLVMLVRRHCQRMHLPCSSLRPSHKHLLPQRLLCLLSTRSQLVRIRVLLKIHRTETSRQRGGQQRERPRSEWPQSNLHQPLYRSMATRKPNLDLGHIAWAGTATRLPTKSRMALHCLHKPRQGPGCWLFLQDHLSLQVLVCHLNQTSQQPQHTSRRLSI